MQYGAIDYSRHVRLTSQHLVFMLRVSTFWPLHPSVDIYFDFFRLNSRSGIATSQGRCVFNFMRVAKQIAQIF